MNDLDAIFKPRSIAVVGASDRENTINRALFMNLILGNFKGPVFPVNPKHSYVHGIRAYKTVEEIPDPVDLAIIIVPRIAVMEIVDSCGRKGVKGLVVITAGFKETGPEGAAIEKELLEKVKLYGMRMIGPNCFGVMNTSSEINMNATFSSYESTKGKVGFISQSGALGEILIERAHNVALGMAMFASVGNKADIDGDEIVAYWENEDDVKAIMLYIENIGEPRKFSEIAKRISQKKPIITLKAGRTARGASAATSHTGALGDQDAANQAIFEQYGVIQVDSVGSLFQVGNLIVNQPLPRGRGVGVVTNAGGPGILATDALVNQGFLIPEICAAGQEELCKRLRPEASLHNPIDLIASGGPEEYRAAIEVCFSQDDIHTIVVLFIPTLMIDAMQVAEVIAEFSERREKTMQVVWLAQGKIRGAEAEQLLKDKGVPLYEMPIEAAGALASALHYNEWKLKPYGKMVQFDVDLPAARNLVTEALSDGRSSLTDEECFKLLNIYGLPTLPTKRVSSRDEALEAAQELGYPVVLKASSLGLIHKTEVGGVQLNIKDPKELMDAYGLVKAGLENHGMGDKASYLVQPMVSTDGGGVECVLGLKNLSKYGPMIMFGLGGIFIEILNAVGFRMVPLTDEDAMELITTSPAWPILAGARGRPPVNVDKLVEAILRLGQMAWENPELSEIDLNPFFAFPDGSHNVALDQVILISNQE